MWYAFWSVIHDLWLFSIGNFTTTPQTASFSQLHLAGPINPLQLSTTKPVIALPSSPVVPLGLPVMEEVSIPSVVSTRLGEPSIMYVLALPGTVCLSEPGGRFDAIITNLSFGTAVTVSGFSGRYAHVLKENYTGWIVKDDLTPHKQDVWPELVTWGMYGADNPDTIKIRALINDEFGAGTLNLPLQAGEYILLRLLQDKRTIVWPDGRPRMPGDWHALLKGTLGIHTTITPKTDTVMEWQTESDGGRLAYVEAVGLDGVITTSCVGLVVAGQYTKQVWGAEDWKELRPVFIEVS